MLMRCCPISEPTFLTLWKVRSLSKAHVRDVIFNGFYLLDGNEFFLFLFSFITRSGLKEFSIFTKWLENGFAWELAFKIHYIFPTSTLIETVPVYVTDFGRLHDGGLWRGPFTQCPNATLSWILTKLLSKILRAASFSFWLTSVNSKT